jgi:hypothetical protein
MRILAASGQLGYGFTEEALANAMDTGVDFIGCDSGSMDPGPYYLGAGVPFVSDAALERDLTLLLRASTQKSVPLIIGSAGGGGGHPHVAHIANMVQEIARREALHFPMATIGAEPPLQWLIEQIAAKRVESLGPIAPLTETTLRNSHRIVAMMGVEPIQAALDGGAQVVIAGRASDAAIFAAMPLQRGFDAGLAWHLGKIIECAGQVIEPRTGQDCVVGTLEKDHFFVEPGHPDKKCTLRRVAGHTLYETPDPFIIHEPGGALHTSDCSFEQVDERRVKVAGSRFVRASQYTVKLEGVESLGYRMVFFAGIRDPVLIGCIDEFVSSCHQRAGDEAQNLGFAPESYQLSIKVYGRDAVMGEREPVTHGAAHEVAVLADVVAADEKTARAVIAKARYALLHTDFPGRQCIAGNLAIPFSPSDLSAGEVYGFNVWHTVALDDPLALFPISYQDC